MADGVVSINLKDVSRLADTINAMKLSSSDRRKLLGDIGVEMETQTDSRFDQKTDPGGNDWADLAERTLEWYARHPMGNPPLVRSGALQGSIASEVEGDDTVFVGTLLKYGIYHQEGTKKMPPRPFAGLEAPGDVSEVERVVENFLRRKTGGG